MAYSVEANKRKMTPKKTGSLTEKPRLLHRRAREILRDLDDERDCFVRLAHGLTTDEPTSEDAADAFGFD